MKDEWSNVLPVYGLRYHVAWLFVCIISFTFIVLLFSYQIIEYWIYRNDKLTTAQQDDLTDLIRPLGSFRLDGPFLRWQQKFRSSAWLWRQYHDKTEDHPVKRLYKEGSEPLFYYSERNPLQILLVGDSLAESIQLSLSPLLSRIPSVSLKSNAIVSSTLTNKHFVDWPKTLRQLLGQRHYDLVLVFIGANSCQAVRNDDGTIVGYGSKAWEKAYGGRIRDFIQLIKGEGAATWWLINPQMLKPDYQRCMASISKVQRQVGQELADEIIETAPIVGADDGGYAQSKVIDGKVYSLRSRDGVHFTIEGSRLVSEEILLRIYQRYKIRSSMN